MTSNKHKRFCVYFHRNIQNGEVFYIGKGNNLRPYSSSNRNKDWRKYVSANGGFSVEIFSDNLSNDEAIELECSLLNSGEYPLVVNKLFTNTTTTDVQGILNSFYYDTSSPTFLRWKVKPRCSTIMVGDVAGSVNQNGYTKVMLNGKQLNAHRVVWILLKGEIPEGFVINHIDCNKRNNKIDNLEIITQKQNTRKSYRHLQEDNLVGISLSSDKKKWCASYVLNGVPSIKSFSMSLYGDLSKDMAIDYRRIMLITEDDPTLSESLLLEFSNKYNYKLKRDFPTGVAYLGNRFKAYKRNNGKEISKYFNINKLGYDNALSLAIKWRTDVEL